MAGRQPCDSLWLGADIVTLRDGRYHLQPAGAIAVRAGRILWCGAEADAGDFAAAQVTRFTGGIITPGLVDCHTHLVFGGDRSDEFAQRLEGVTYADIAARGGGILGTVRATRAASQAALQQQAAARIACLLAEGVTLLEIKSGYGLDVASELRMLQTIRALGDALPLTIKATCLAAHAVPPEFAGDPDGWIDCIVHQLLPRVAQAGLADAVDAFCEHLAFTPAQVARVFDAAQSLGLPVKLHAEQLSALGGSSLAARYHALSADHLEYITEDDVRAMAASGTVAVLLPGAYYLLRETRCPPVALFRQYGVPMALASDSNPGTSPVLSLRLMLNMACTLFGLTPEEALAGVTLWGARALGEAHQRGSIEAGKYADFVHWPVAHPAQLVYWLGGQIPCQTIVNGERRQ
ncbi:imidazolonepropionase [Pantoea sp. 1.19]|uniref:imidazolonepropionase n=1 Tax=Pantoea sp. 1.19 TaxID=1925589 RepID=UPI000948AE80|nr:imidazolonepropionase [Pantoea sp. 1.19]